jgi:hypothetical protein
MSGRASAAVDIKTPAPMVAASATAILNDINLSAFASFRPCGPEIRCKSRKIRVLPPVCPRIFNRSR